MEVYAGVEFLENSEIALVHTTWLTPMKRQTFWPPYKTSGLFNKALSNGEEPDQKIWKLYPLKRLFFYCENLEKARKKLKKCEETSDIQSSESDFESLRMKRRLRAKRYLSNSSSEDEEPKGKLPRPPSLPKLPMTSICGDSNVSQVETSTPIRRSKVLLTSGTGSNIDLSGLPTRSIEHVDITLTNDVTENNTTINVSINALEKIYRQVKKLGEDMKEVKGLLKQSKKASNTPGIPDNLPVEFPLITRENFETLEDYLNQEENFNDLALYLSTIGGNGFVSKVNKILRLLLSDVLALNYNFAGQRNKQAFGLSKLNSLVIKAIQITSPSTTRNEIENAVKTWLKHSKQRIDRKESRSSIIFCKIIMWKYKIY